MTEPVIIKLKEVDYRERYPRCRVDPQIPPIPRNLTYKEYRELLIPRAHMHELRMETRMAVSDPVDPEGPPCRLDGEFCMEAKTLYYRWRNKPKCQHDVFRLIYFLTLAATRAGIREPLVNGNQPGREVFFAGRCEQDGVGDVAH